MERLKQAWKRIPNKPRRVLTFIVGMLLIITSGLIGWIPGPGGMIPFLLGVAVLATEFTWAERFRDWLLDLLKDSGSYIKRHPVVSITIAVLLVGLIAIIAYAFYNNIM